MKVKQKWYALFLILSFVTIFGCTESFEIENDRIEDFLVINALVTDKVSNQRILLSRTFGFEENDPIPEEGAVIVVIENGVKEYQFNEITSGEYYSLEEFGAIAGNDYQLRIKTSKGRVYASSKVIAPTPTSIGSVYAERMINNNGTDGIGVFSDTFDPTGNSLYYRYAYEETYKIIAPDWVSVNLTSMISSPDNVVTFGKIERPESQKKCYNTERSTVINAVNTSNYTEDRIENHMINFIPVSDLRVSNRYSILVKQYVQTREAHAFYDVLSNFSGSESVFSQVQPGFIGGNVFSITDDKENVIGFFDVSSIAEQRIFFNRDEFISDLPFVLECKPFTPKPGNTTIESFIQSIHALIQGNTVRWLIPSQPLPLPGEIPVFTFVPRVCGDCTVVGKSEAPDFWVD